MEKWKILLTDGLQDAGISMLTKEAEVDNRKGISAEELLNEIGNYDAMIVRGLIAILHALYSGLTLEEVLKVDAPAALARLGLDEHLSSQRSNGLRAMVGRIRKLAGEAVAA